MPTFGVLSARLSLSSILVLFALVGLGNSAVGQEAPPPEGLPLEPARSLALTVDEATWLSVDVSPDGDSVVMEVLGDLYALPIAGGEARVLTHGMAFDSQPAFSPDGRWVAFISDRSGAENIWIMRADGSDERELTKERQNTELASPSWTPDGEWVVFSRSSQGLRTYELWMVNVRGGQGVQITRAKTTPETPRDERHNALGAVASPDGRYFYYARREGGFEYNTDFPMWQIARWDRRTGDDDEITATQGSALRPRLSPDGRLLAYATRRDNETGLRLRDLETGEERWLAHPVQRDEQESRYTRDLYPGYAFTPDGSSIVTTWGGHLHRIDVATGAATLIPFTVPIDLELGPQLRVAQRVETGPVRSRLAMGAEPSPDGNRVAFSSFARIWVAELGTGGTPVPLSPEGIRAYQPTWSHDGRFIAYVSWSTDGGHLWKIPATGGTPQQLSEVAAFYAEPAWSPDGSRIVALRAARQARLEMPAEFGGSALPKDLVWIAADGGAAQLIAPARGLGKPHFTADESDRFYVYSQEGLVSMRYDGTDRRTHVQIEGPGLYAAEEPVPAREIRISPDRKWVLATVSNRFYLAALPQVGGRPPEVDLAKPSVPLRKLTLLGADSFSWANGGSTVTWTLGSTFFRLPVAEVSFAEPESGGENGAAAESRSRRQRRRAAQPEPEAEAEKPEPMPDAESFDLTVERPRAHPHGIVALRGARIVTMRGDEVIERADLVVEDDRILAVGPAGEVDIPATATEIDLTGRTVVPGFIDTHAHWTEIRRGVLDTESWPFLANLAWGVTTGLDVQTGTNDTFAYQDLIDAGEMIGPRAYSTGPGIFSDTDIQTLVQARGILERYRDYYRTRNLKAYITGNRRQRQLLVQAARELGMMPTTEGSLDLKLDLTHAMDGFAGNEHALPVVPLAEDVVELYARSGISYTPTLLVAYGGPWAENQFYTSEPVHDRAKLRRFVPHEILDAKTRRRAWFRADEHIYPGLAAEAARIVRAGGLVGVGGHGQLQGLGYHWEMWALASGGLVPLEVLRCATRLGAEIIGRSADLGSLEPGKLADLVVLERNPLDDIRNTDSVLYVMKNGELFDGDTLDQVWPEHRSLPPLWWWSAEPPSSSVP